MRIAVAAGIALAVPAGTAERPSLTAEQVLAASGATTSIGPDPCRKLADEEEIVVCGRRESPYGLPLYDPVARDESLTGRGREHAVENMQREFAPCHARGEACLRPLPVLTFGPKGLVVGKD